MRPVKPSRLRLFSPTPRKVMRLTRKNQTCCSWNRTSSPHERFPQHMAGVGGFQRLKRLAQSDSSRVSALTPQGVKRDTGPQVRPAGVRHTSFSGGTTPPKETTYLEPPRLGAARLALFSGLTLKVSDMTSGLCCGSGSSYPSGVPASRGSTRPSQLFSVPTVRRRREPGRRTSCQSEASPPTDAKLHSGTGDDKVRSNDEVLITRGCRGLRPAKWKTRTMIAVANLTCTYTPSNSLDEDVKEETN